MTTWQGRMKKNHQVKAITLSHLLVPLEKVWNKTKPAKRKQGEDRKTLKLQTQHTNCSYYLETDFSRSWTLQVKKNKRETSAAF